MAKKVTKKRVSPRKIAESKMTQLGSPARKRKRQATGKKFNAEGSGYDKRTAVKQGMGADSKDKHWYSLGAGGKVLKGRKHPTYKKTEEAEAKRGSKIVKKGSRYYAVPKKKTTKKKK
jgi:hypothetical protein